jgi:hypothetical protein
MRRKLEGKKVRGGAAGSYREISVHLAAWTSKCGVRGGSWRCGGARVHLHVYQSSPDWTRTLDNQNHNADE